MAGASAAARLRAAAAGEERASLRDWFAGCDDAASVAAAAEALLADGAWVADALWPLLTALIDDPWFQPAWPVARDALRTTAILHDDARVTVTATVFSARALATLPPPTTVAAIGRLAVARYHRAGGARLRRWALPDDGTARAAERAALDLDDGAVLRLDGRREVQLLAGARSDVVVIAVAAKPGATAWTREIALADGALVGVTPREDAPERREMLRTLLRATGRSAACPA